jgi:hypothetical protein
MAMQNEKWIPAPAGYQPFSSDQSWRAHVCNRKATGSRKEFIAMQERVTGNLTTLLKDYNETRDGPSYGSSARSCRELFLKVWPSSFSSHDGSSQHCLGRNTPAAQPSKTRILTASSIPRTTTNKIRFRTMDSWNDADRTTDYSQVGREPYQKRIISCLRLDYVTTWMNHTLGEVPWNGSGNYIREREPTKPSSKPSPCTG